MKTASRTIKAVSQVAAIIGVIVLTATPSFAVTATTDTSSTTTTTTTQPSCTRINALASTSSAAISTKLTAMDNDFATRLSTVTANHASIDNKVATFRQNLVANFNKKVATMLAQKGLTDNQKTAIQAYSAAALAAEKTRETNVDQARDAYRTALSATIQTHQSDLTDAATTFQTSVAAAFTTAEANCGDGTALSTLKTDVKTARDAFASARTADKTTATIKQLMASRDAAIKSADSNFNQTLATDTATLSAALAK